MADEERRLVETAQRGDVESFNALVRLYEGRLYNLCYRMLGDADSAPMPHRMRSFRPSATCAASAAARSAPGSCGSPPTRCYDVLRARKRRPTTSLDIETDGGEDLSPLQIADSSESPDDFALRRELATAIQQGLATLPEEQRRHPDPERHPGPGL